MADPNPNPVEPPKASSMRDGKYVDPRGALLASELVSDTDKLMDDTVNTVFDFATDLMAQIARFRGHTIDDICATLELLAEKYGYKRGGEKGNASFTSFDGLRKIEVSVQDRITYGPELQIAKGLIDEYILEVSDGVDPAVSALLNHAFEVDKTGKVNRTALYGLRRLVVDHPKWKAAMGAITDSMRVIGSKEYVRISRRAHNRASWKSLPINLANAMEMLDEV